MGVIGRVLRSPSTQNAATRNSRNKLLIFFVFYVTILSSRIPNKNLGIT